MNGDFLWAEGRTDGESDIVGSLFIRNLECTDWGKGEIAFSNSLTWGNRSEPRSHLLEIQLRKYTQSRDLLKEFGAVSESVHFRRNSTSRQESSTDLVEEVFVSEVSWVCTFWAVDGLNLAQIELSVWVSKIMGPREIGRPSMIKNWEEVINHLETVAQFGLYSAT